MEVKTRVNRKIKIGRIISNKMDKTVVVSVERQFAHPVYKKILRNNIKLAAHDELKCNLGDKVKIMETRPLSKTKRWRVVEILEKAK
ncbi:MAG: 30S ribosomal protein S17 [Armatimonadetes bacterium]|nr:30S ribosomal protein S17 [Armatimonadota bacterium]